MSRVTPLLAVPSDSTGHGKSSKKQVTMIAQKVMYANQPQQPICWLVTVSDAGTSTFWAAWCQHSEHLPSRFQARGVFDGVCRFSA